MTTAFERERKRQELAPIDQQFYRDHPRRRPERQPPEVEMIYRNSFLVGWIEACSFESLSDFDKPLEVARLERLAARKAATIGKHWVFFRANHELAASRTRGRHHGMVTVQYMLERGQDLDGISRWIPALREWASGSCDTVEEPPDMGQPLMIK